MDRRIGIGIGLAAAAAVGAWWLAGKPLALPSRDAAAAVHKCSGGGRVVYTDGECPRGTARERISDDRFSVLPAAPAAATAASAASAVPLLRRLAGPDERAEFQRRVIERAEGR